MLQTTPGSQPQPHTARRSFFARSLACDRITSNAFLPLTVYRIPTFAEAFRTRRRFRANRIRSATRRRECTGRCSAREGRWWPSAGWARPTYIWGGPRLVAVCPFRRTRHRCYRNAAPWRHVWCPAKQKIRRHSLVRKGYWRVRMANN